MGRADRRAGVSTVAETLAKAEAWNERAALLSTLGFELSDLFGAPWSSLAPIYLVRRLTGGASAANPQRVEDLCGELFAAAERAREEARALLASAAKPSSGGMASSLDGSGHVAPRVDCAAIEIRSGGDEIEANPACSPGRRRLAPGEMPPSPKHEEQEADRYGREEQQSASVTPLRGRRSRR